MDIAGHMMFKQSITGQIAWTILYALNALGVIFLIRGALSPLWLGILSLTIVIVMAAINSRIFQISQLKAMNTLD